MSDFAAVGDSRVTVHMAASLDGFVARKDGSVDWLETSDEFGDGKAMSAAVVEAFLEEIDCYVMGSRTYETAVSFEAKGLGWSYGDKPTFVLTRRELPRTRDSVQFYSGDLAELLNVRLRPMFRSIWVVGGAVVAAECLRLGLADELRYSILPILIGDGIPFFDRLDRDFPLHLAKVDAYDNGTVELCYEVRRTQLVSGVLTSPAEPMLSDAIARTLEAPPADRVQVLARLVRKIEDFMAAHPAERPWTCCIYMGTDGSHIFRGGVGHSLVIDPAGRLWRARSYEDFVTTYQTVDGRCEIDQLTPLYSQMREYLPR